MAPRSVCVYFLKPIMCHFLSGVQSAILCGEHFPVQSCNFQDVNRQEGSSLFDIPPQIESVFARCACRCVLQPRCQQAQVLQSVCLVRKETFVCRARSFGTANSVFSVRSSMLGLIPQGPACGAGRGACTVHAMPVDWESLLHGMSDVVVCASRQDVICFRFLHSKTSRGVAHLKHLVWH